MLHRDAWTLSGVTPKRQRPNLFSINAWNEWTEGAYIEPDEVTGMGYLEAIAKVFGASANTLRQLKIKQAISKAKVL
ncbi:MAG: glycoside hydrolase family 99-like domain-containing protein [Verrucomicrobia bacterium]|nr:glycoside hydrolase family 99-like domain-containing protein [Verrucomicrobiota bacterium]